MREQSNAGDFTTTKSLIGHYRSVANVGSEVGYT